MAQYDTEDFVRRLRFFAGAKRWASAEGWNDGADSRPVGQLYALFRPVASALSALMAMWVYVRLQTRLATLTDSFVDFAWGDFFAGRDGRRVGESDAASTGRLRSRLTAPSGTYNAVLSAVQQWFALNPDASIAVGVFDRQTDPTRARYYGIRDSQFAVILYERPATPGSGWFIGQSFIGQDAVVADPFAFSVSFIAPYPGLASAINDVKDLGYRPVYVVSRGEPPNLGQWGSAWGQPWGTSSAP